MSKELEAALRYRNHSQLLRLIAADEGGLKHRATLSEVADDYDRMADALEAADKARKTVEKPTMPRTTKKPRF